MMAHMVSCTFTGGPFDGTVREVNSLKNEVEFDNALNPRPIPPIAEDAVMPEIRALRHVYKRDGDLNEFIYAGFY